MDSGSAEAQVTAREPAGALLDGRKVGTGAAWRALNTGVLRASTFAVSLIVARLVTPHEFGVFTVALTVYNITIMLTTLGIGSAIVREHDRTRELAPTAATLSIVSGSLIAILMVITAPILARELGAEQASGAIRAMALIAVLAGISAVPAALQTRDFLQRQRFVADGAFFVVSTATMLALVLSGHAVMGLAWGQVAGQLASVALILRMAPERYWPGFDWGVAKHLISFGVPLSASEMVTMAIANVDFVIVGHWLGARELGYYTLAFNIAGWPITMFMAVLVSVTLPTLSRARTDRSEFNRHIRAGLSALTALAFPLCAMLVALAGPVIDVVYGSKWHPAWRALVILAVFGAARTVLGLFTEVIVALGRTRRLLAMQGTWLVCLILALIVCVGPWGILGAGIAHAVVVTVVAVPIYLAALRADPRVELRTLASCVLRPLSASVVAGAAAFLASLPVDGAGLKLLVGLACGVVVYVLVAGRWTVRLGRTLRVMYWQRPPASASPGPPADPHARVRISDNSQPRES